MRPSRLARVASRRSRGEAHGWGPLVLPQAVSLEVRLISHSLICSTFRASTNERRAREMEAASSTPLSRSKPLRRPSLDAPTPPPPRTLSRPGHSSKPRPRSRPRRDVQARRTHARRARGWVRPTRCRVGIQTDDAGCPLPPRRANTHRVRTSHGGNVESRRKGRGVGPGRVGWFNPTCQRATERGKRCSEEGLC